MATTATTTYGVLRYIKEVTPGVTPTTGSPTNLRFLKQSFKAGVTSKSSEEMRLSRMAAGQSITDLTISGSVEVEMLAREYDEFLQAMLGNTFVHYGTNGLGDKFTLTSLSMPATGGGFTTLTASAALTGASAFTTLPKGRWFKIIPPSTQPEANRKYFRNTWFKVASTTATTVVVDSSTPITPPNTVAAVADFALSSSAVVNSTNASDLASYSFEYVMSDVQEYLMYRGNRVDSFDLSVEVGDMAKASFGFVGMNHPGMLGASSMPAGAPKDSFTTQPMNAVTDVAFLRVDDKSILDGVTSYVKSAKVELKNNLRSRKAVGVFGSTGVSPGALDVGGTLEVYLEDSALYNKALANTSFSIEIGLTDAEGYGYLIELPKAAFTDNQLNTSDTHGDVMLSLPIKAFDDGTGTGIRITRCVPA